MRILLMTVYTAMAAIHFMRTLLPVFTIQELGWTNMHYSEVYAFSNLTGGVVGMLLGALIIHRFGIVRLIQSSLLTMVILSVIMYLSVDYWKSEYFINGFVLAFCICVNTCIYWCSGLGNEIMLATGFLADAIYVLHDYLQRRTFHRSQCERLLCYLPDMAKKVPCFWWFSCISFTGSEIYKNIEAPGTGREAGAEISRSFEIRRVVCSLTLTQLEAY